MTRTALWPVNEIHVGHRRPVHLAHVTDLADSIGTLGLLQPVVVTMDKMLVAGRHRLEAVKRLGWATVPVVVVDLTELQAQIAVLDENLVRNDLSRLERFEHLVQRADLLAAMGKRQRPGRPVTNSDTMSALPMTTDEIAGASGLSGRTLQRAAKIITALPEDVRDSLKGTTVADSTTELLRLARLGHDDQRAVAELVAWGTKGAVNDLLLAVKRRRRKDEVARHLDLQVGGDESVHVGRFEDLGHVIPDGEASLFVCDPPYSDLKIYGDLGRFAAGKLRPGGWLAAYCSIHLLDRVMEEVGRHLRLYWMISIRCTGAKKQVHGFRVLTGWKPIIVFQKPPKTKPPEWINDFHFGGGERKDHHHWEQPVDEAKYLIERLTNPGDLVVDPTCGSGTSLVAARLTGRTWIGIDSDPDAAGLARLRLRECGEGRTYTPRPAKPVRRPSRS